MRNKKVQICKEGKLIEPSQAVSDLFNTAVGTASDLFVHHGLPWMGKKAVEMGRYYGSEALRNPKLQKKAIDYALDKLNPMIQNVGSQALNQLSTKIRPKKNYKTNRKDLDGGALDIQNILNQKWLPEFQMRTWRGKKCNYCGPNTRLEERLARGDEGINRLDQVCKQHDIDYSNALSSCDKHSADQKMIDAIEQYPNQSLTERAIKNTIKLKKKLGLGLN